MKKRKKTCLKSLFAYLSGIVNVCAASCLLPKQTAIEQRGEEQHITLDHMVWDNSPPKINSFGPPINTVEISHFLFIGLHTNPHPHCIRWEDINTTKSYAGKLRNVRMPMQLAPTSLPNQFGVPSLFSQTPSPSPSCWIPPAVLNCSSSLPHQMVEGFLQQVCTQDQTSLPWTWMSKESSRWWPGLQHAGWTPLPQAQPGFLLQNMRRFEINEAT